jgi:hypothetical protein
LEPTLQLTGSINLTGSETECMSSNLIFLDRELGKPEKIAVREQPPQTATFGESSSRPGTLLPPFDPFIL